MRCGPVGRAPVRLRGHPTQFWFTYLHSGPTALSIFAMILARYGQTKISVIGKVRADNLYLTSALSLQFTHDARLLTLTVVN